MQRARAHCIPPDQSYGQALPCNLAAQLPKWPLLRGHRVWVAVNENAGRNAYEIT